MKSFINFHCGELDKEVMNILEAHPEWWEEIVKSDILHTIYYDIIGENGELLGFFGNAYWNNGGELECVLCCVYVKEEYRRQGLFKKIVKYTLEHNTNAKIISIGAMSNNELAINIYNHMFRFSHRDKENNGYWFLIKDRRNR